MNPRTAINDLLPFQGAPSAAWVLLHVPDFIVCISGEDGIRTHAPFRTNGFQDRRVMTTSLPLHFSASQYLTIHSFFLSIPIFTKINFFTNNSKISGINRLIQQASAKHPAFISPQIYSCELHIFRRCNLYILIGAFDQFDLCSMDVLCHHSVIRYLNLCFLLLHQLLIRIQNFSVGKGLRRLVSSTALLWGESLSQIPGNRRALWYPSPVTAATQARYLGSCRQNTVQDLLIQYRAGAVMNQHPVTAPGSLQPFINRMVSLSPARYNLLYLLKSEFYHNLLTGTRKYLLRRIPE